MILYTVYQSVFMPLPSKTYSMMTPWSGPTLSLDQKDYVRNGTGDQKWKDQSAWMCMGRWMWLEWLQGDPIGQQISLKSTGLFIKSETTSAGFLQSVLYMISELSTKKKKGRRRRIDTYTVEKKFKKKRKVKDKEKNVNLLSSRSKGWYWLVEMCPLRSILFYLQQVSLWSSHIWFNIDSQKKK